MADIDKIELRSEKVRHIIGEIPPSIVRSGIMIITIIILSFLGCAYFISYPENIKGEAIALNTNNTKVFIPYKYVNAVNIGMKIKVEFEGYDPERYGYQRGIILDISINPVTKYDNNFFVVQMYMDVTTYKVIEGMIGNATILISNKTILQHILNEND